jgi:MerR family mercuric resistance operon transcriptional regulator
MSTLTTGRLSHETGVGIETIRFYERIGLLAEPPRRASGYRQYPEEAVRQLRFIKRAQELGFSLNAIKELLALRLDPPSDCEDLRARAEAKITAIEGKIRHLQRMTRALRTLASACPGQGTTAACPIVEALEDRAG